MIGGDFITKDQEKIIKEAHMIALSKMLLKQGLIDNRTYNMLVKKFTN